MKKMVLSVIVTMLVAFMAIGTPAAESEQEVTGKTFITAVRDNGTSVTLIMNYVDGVRRLTVVDGSVEPIVLDYVGSVRETEDGILVEKWGSGDIDSPMTILGAHIVEISLG